MYVINILSGILLHDTFMRPRSVHVALHGQHLTVANKKRCNSFNYLLNHLLFTATSWCGESYQLLDMTLQNKAALHSNLNAQSRFDPWVASLRRDMVLKGV